MQCQVNIWSILVEVFSVAPPLILMLVKHCTKDLTVGTEFEIKFMYKTCSSFLWLSVISVCLAVRNSHEKFCVTEEKTEGKK
jgi:hypothetical protein